MGSNAYNIYCDESRVENSDARHMAIGAIIIPRQYKTRIVSQIKALKKEHNFFQEIKWNKVGKKYYSFYKKLILFFVQNDLLSFRGIIVDKKKIQYDIYHHNDSELAFFKFYYLLLKDKLKDDVQYYIYLDRKPTRDKNRARALKKFLDSYLLYHKPKSSIKHLQAYDSHENVLIQLADFFTGLIGYINNETESKNLKFQLAKFLETKAKISLTKTTSLTESKINLLKWRPKL